MTTAQHVSLPKDICPLHSGLWNAHLLLECATRARVEERERRGESACAPGEQVGVRRRRQRQRLPAVRLSKSRAVLGSKRERQRDNRPAEECYVSACGAPFRDDYRPECPDRPSRGRTPTDRKSVV